MMDRYWDIAEEIINSTFRPLNPALADRMIARPEPLREQCRKFLSCFKNCRDLDDLFREYAIDFQGSLDDLERFHDIYNLGFFSGRTQNMTPEWFVFQLPILDLEYRYFPSLRNAIEFIVQMALHEHMRGIFEYFDTSSDWRSIFEKQLVHAYVCNRWHEMGGDCQASLNILRDCFSNLNLIYFKRLDDFVMTELFSPAENNKLLDDYQAFFQRPPQRKDLNQIECWSWLLKRLPESY